jgi:hypothetical protein
VSLWTVFILLPTFTLLNESKYSVVLTSDISSIWDQLSLADALMNPQVINLVLIFTILYSALVLHFIIFGIGLPMSTEFEFPVENHYVDTYVSSHTLMIRGLNPNLDIETAKGKLRTLFGERFPNTKIVAVHVVREG